MVRGALLMLALAVVDDAFVHPEPGTGIGDHVASGSVPAAAALAVAVLYPRLRAGLRATVLLGYASVAIVAGVVDGLRHVLVDRLAGDDVTAMLALAAGVVLGIVGVAVLWRSRRRDDALPRRYLRRSVITVGAVVGAYFVVLPIALAVVVNHKARSRVPAADLGTTRISR